MKKIIGIILVIVLIFALGCTQSNPNINDANSDIGGDTMVDNNTDGGNQFNNLDQFRKVKEGDNVSVHYAGKLENGNIFDSSIGKQPLSFTVGAGQMIKGFDDAVVGMKAGDIKTATLPPEEAYGTVDPNKIITFDKNNVPDFDKMEVGQSVVAGNGVPGKIISKDENSLVIDFNHDLAGKTLIFEIQLVSIS